MHPFEPLINALVDIGLLSLFLTLFCSVCLPIVVVMTVTVIRSVEVMVPPSESTPSGTFNLSMIDKAMLGVNVRVLNVFRRGHEAAGKVVREALSKALVSYYPLAGRLIESSEGGVQIGCTGDGVWFIDASSNCSLDSVNYFDNIPMHSTDELFPSTPPESYGVDPILQIQISSFSCKGFTMGLVFSHGVLDGSGAGQFLNAIGEFARGLPHPTIVPVVQREAIFAPARLAPKLQHHLPPPFTAQNLEYACIDFSLTEINKLKEKFFESTGERCSSFDVVTACFWQQRTKAIDLEKNTNVKLVFAVNTRKFLDAPLVKGFYGNCLFLARVSTSSGYLVKASNAEIVKLIKDAKDKVQTDFKIWMGSSDQLDDGDDPYATSLSYTTLTLSDWRHLGFYQVDYGWGQPVHVFLVSAVAPFGVLGFAPATPNTGIRLLTFCFTKEHILSLEI